jgi:uncharacterized protein YjbI with pentapeptide repeats
MDSFSARRRALAGIAALGLGLGLVTAFGASAATAATCPTVSLTGVVSPAASPDVDWSGCDLNEANLSGSDLSGADLSGSSLERANLTSSNLTDADFDLARLYYTTMTGANLAGAILAGSHLYLVVSGQVTGIPASFPTDWSLGGGYLLGPYVNLENADLAGADLAGADLADATITEADLADADLASADFANANLYESNLSGANLTDANLDTFYVDDLTLTGANLSGTQFAYNGNLSGVVSGGITGTPANLPYYPDGQWMVAGGYLIGPGVDLAGVDLAGLNLSGAALVAGANLSDANLTGVKLSDAALGANISGTELAGANLTDLDSQGVTGTPASLPAQWEVVDDYLLGPTVEAIYANLSGADLAGLDLAGSQFNYADLVNADLNDADLAGSYIWYANLTGATAAGADFTGTSWFSTTCPDGSDSNVFVDGCFSPLDTTLPLLHLSVQNDQVLAAGAPAVQCTATDEYKPVTTQPTLTITGRSVHGLGRFTATCSGAIDQAGLTARPVSATYWVAYGFDGMQPAQNAAVPTNPRVLAVSFGLSPATGQLSAAAGRAMARRHDVRVTLRGPGIRPATAICDWDSRQSEFVCKLTLPHGIKIGSRHRYTLTAYENDGFGFVVAPGEPTAENPVTIHFR